ncbi:MAG: hypothetical protein BWZ08_02512 [candidate division BRC1 bacterium ADurb.BinA292]|nr:MAG: hypothetical protein BWZ08_02512 [candidate division BRC1 bacterium ADurb.BinA292]
MEVDPLAQDVAVVEQADQFAEDVAPRRVLILLPELDHEPPPPAVTPQRQIAIEPVARLDAQVAEERVARQVVQQVGADRIRHQVEDVNVVGRRLALARRGLEQPQQALVELAAQGRPQEPARRALRADESLDPLAAGIVAREEPQLVLQRVAERDVADVVQQREEPRQQLFLGRDVALLAVRAGIPADRLDHPPRRAQRPQRVIEPRVQRRRVDQIRRAELADEAQPLERGRVDQPRFEPRQFDVAADRQPDRLVGGQVQPRVQPGQRGLRMRGERATRFRHEAHA